MYVNVDRLVDALAHFKRDAPVYFGRAGSRPDKPRRVLPGQETSMYCIERNLSLSNQDTIGPD